MFLRIDCWMDLVGILDLAGGVEAGSLTPSLHIQCWSVKQQASRSGESRQRRRQKANPPLLERVRQPAGVASIVRNGRDQIEQIGERSVIGAFDAESSQILRLASVLGRNQIGGEVAAEEAVEGGQDQAVLPSIAWHRLLSGPFVVDEGQGTHHVAQLLFHDHLRLPGTTESFNSILILFKLSNLQRSTYFSS